MVLRNWKTFRLIKEPCGSCAHDFLIRKGKKKKAFTNNEEKQVKHFTECTWM